MRAAIAARIMRTKCDAPLPNAGRTSGSPPIVTRPTRSCAFTALHAVHASTRIAASRNDHAPKPTSIPGRTSSMQMTVRSRSSTKRLTNRRPMRAVTEGSTARGSSPGTYSRTSPNSMPAPRSAERCPPEVMSSANRRPTSGIPRTLRRMSDKIDSIRTASMDQGIGTAAVTRATTASAVTPPASAS